MIDRGLWKRCQLGNSRKPIFDRLMTVSGLGEEWLGASVANRSCHWARPLGKGEPCSLFLIIGGQESPSLRRGHGSSGLRSVDRSQGDGLQFLGNCFFTLPARRLDLTHELIFLFLLSYIVALGEICFTNRICQWILQLWGAHFVQHLFGISLLVEWVFINCSFLV